MGLKLMLEKGDKILVGDDTIVTVMALGRRPQIHIDAPADVKLRHIKADPERQFLKRKRMERSPSIHPSLQA
jgi:hypothetical protein